MQGNGAKSPLFHLRGRTMSGRALQRSDNTASPTFDSPIPPPSAPSEMPASPNFGQTTPQLSPAKVPIDGYQPSPVNANAGFNKRPRSSALLNTNDPVAMHLLVETAIGDSQHFEILSFDELESLKKEYVLTVAKLEGVKRKLVMESKVREAAQSLLRLYTKKGKHGSTGSLPRSKKNTNLSGTPQKPGSSGSDHSTIEKTEDELAASGRKCEELAADLWKLEKRAGDLQSRILRHTAGILSMARRRPSSKRDWIEEVQPMWPLRPEGTSKGAMPGSPESIYTYDNARGSGTIDFGDEFGDRSLYIEPGNGESYGVGQRQSGLDARSHTHLSSSSEYDFQQQEFQRHNEAFASLESRLAELNHRLRDLLLHTHPERYQHYDMPPELPLDNPRDIAAAEMTFQQQLDYLEHGLDAVSEEHYGGLQNLRQSDAIESKLHTINERIYRTIDSSGMQSEPPYPPPPSSDSTAEMQLSYLDEGLETVQQLHHEMIRMLQDSGSTRLGELERVQQYEAVVNELSDIVNAAEDVTRNARRDQMDETQDAADSDHRWVNEDSPASKAQELNLQAFTAKVRGLCDCMASLREQNAVLNGQVEQQKGYKSNEEQKANELDELREEMETLHDRHAAALHEANELRAELGDLTEQLDAANEQILLMQHSHDKNKRDSHAWTAEREAWQRKEDDLTSEAGRKQERIELLEKLMADLDDDMQAAEAEWEEKAAEYEEKLRDKDRRVDALKTEYEEAQRAKAETASRVTNLESELEALRASHTKDLEDKERRIEGLGQTIQEVRTAHGEAINRVTELQHQLDDLHGSHEEARSYAMELQTQLRDKESRIDELGKTLDEARTVHEETTSRARNMESELEGLYHQLQEATGQVRELQAQLESVQSAHKKATARTTGLESELEALRVSHGEVKSYAATLRTQLDSVHASYDEATARVDDLHAEVEALTASYRDVKSHSVELQTQLDSLRASRDEATAHAEDLQSQLEAANSSNTAARARAADLESQLSSLSLSHGKAINHSTDLESQLSAMKASYHSATGRVTELEAEMSEATSRSRALQSQLDNLRTAYDDATTSVRDLQTQLDAANSSKVEAMARAADLESQISALQQTHTNATTHAGDLEGQLSGLRTAHDDATSRAANLESQLSKLQSSHDETSTRVLNLEDELRNLESELVRVHTELTVAKAELDGAYGSRAQRAAEVAANPEIRNQLDELGQRNAALTEAVERMRSENDATIRERDQSKAFLFLVEAARDESAKKVDALEKELQAVVAELEGLVAQAVTMEREREGLEGEVDRLRARCEDLEQRLEEEKVRHLGLGSMVNGEHGPESEGRGMAALRAEFKKLMRESRMDFVRALRAEHDERRRLETTIRTLRKEQAAGRMGASQPVAAA